jgi:Ca2+:H+ antiporter
MLYWMLIFVPIPILLKFIAPEQDLLIFLAASLAIVPLAGWLGRATEQLAGWPATDDPTGSKGCSCSPCT